MWLIAAPIMNFIDLVVLFHCIVGSRQDKRSNNARGKWFLNLTNDYCSWPHRNDCVMAMTRVNRFGAANPVKLPRRLLSSLQQQRRGAVEERL